MRKAGNVWFAAVITLLTMVVVSSDAFGLTGEEVAMEVEKARRGFSDSKSKLVMTLINASGAKSLRKMSNKILEKPKDSKTEGDKSIIVFLSPADVKGTGLLTYERLDREDDQWLYLPALRRIKRIASKNKSGSFMGSEFAYEDISPNPLKNTLTVTQ